MLGIDSQVAAVDGGLMLAASLTISLSAAAVLSAVALNFVLARVYSGKVQRVQKSAVATLSMLGFFLCFYLLVHNRILALELGLGAVRTALVVIGTLLVVIGAWLNIMGRLRLGRNWANQVTIYESQQLVDSGVFAWVRHPLYASLLWMFTGAGIVYLNAAALAATYLVFLPMVYFRARQEEAMLIDDLPGYRDYMRRVGMFWPRPAFKGGKPLAGVALGSVAGQSRSCSGSPTWREARSY
jgi:protein-S-isoprenylcysteine O-methyltransferase Ste14